MASSSESQASGPNPPVAVICIGMAGSGKTTFMHRINSHLHSKDEPPYVINLDPAVLNVPFESNIDIRDSVNYGEVMRQYHLGPNGGILTSLNLFATKVDQVIGLLERRAQPNPEQPNRNPLKHILIDTPGQIEVFVWSASGTILLESLASSFPTVIAYVIDTPRTTSPSTFMSNMLYACSILYKTKLPMILVFNKTDVQDAAFAKTWMTDYEAFQEALRGDDSRDDGSADHMGSGYMTSLVSSMSLVLEEFYAHLSVVGVSSRIGTGMDEFFAAVAEKAEEFKRDYLPELERRREGRDKLKRETRERELDRMMKGMSVLEGEGEGGSAGVLRGGALEKSLANDDNVDFVSDDEVADPDDIPDDRGGPGAGEEQSMLQAASLATYLHTRQNK